MAAPSHPAIRLRGVRQNNLRNIDLDLPVGHLVVVTGLSGAGKSSLVFDALHAEGNRRYAETFSPYTRQFLELLDRPQVDSIENIRPSIAIEQGNTVKTSRSTVGTMTELTDYFKVWFCHAASLFDPETGEPITLDNPQSIWRSALQAFRSRTVLVGFTVRRSGKLDWGTILQSLSAQGYSRAILDQDVLRIDELNPGTMPPNSPLLVIQDRLKIQPGARNRFIEAATSALHFGEGSLSLHDPDGRHQRDYSEGLHRPGSNRRFQPASPNLFSFNSPVGACPQCRGFGRVIEIDDRLVIPDRSLSIEEGAIRAFSGAVYSESLRDLIRACRRIGLPIDVPWQELSEEQRAFVLEGDPDFDWNRRERPPRWYGVRRFFKWLEENTYKMHVRVFLSRYRSYVPCPACGGDRLQPEALCWKWKGHTLPTLYRMPVRDLAALMREADTGDSEGDSGPRARLALDAIRTRLAYLEAVGLDYLTLDRSSRSLSGGETQRVNLTSCLGTSLVDTLFILDEPSVGLHCRDIDRLIGTLRQLTDLGNTVVVVEHDEAIMRAADTIVEIGPAPGAGGGQVVYCGPPSGLRKRRRSPTGQFLSGKRRIHPPARRRPVGDSHPWLRMRGVHCHNLDGLDVDIPLQRLVVLSGVSGSGKSTLLYNAIHQGLLARSGKAVDQPASIRDLSSESGFGEVLLVDQSPVSRTPRSNPAVFVGAWDVIRQLFARTDEARQRALTAAAFSFNSGDGRCPHCQGLGFERVEMQFMADVYVPCPICDGRQFRDEILTIRWEGRNLSEILALTVDEALGVFAGQPRIISRLQSLAGVGLGYLPLGQPLNTLSGGESQRLKLVRYTGDLSSREHPALLLLDEPTTGLHKADIERLLGVLQQLVDSGHSLVVIEHQPDVIRSADWVLELGPEAGDRGGRLVYAGPPEGLTESATPTAPYLLEESAAGAYKPRVGRRRKPRTIESLVVTGAREHNLKNLSTRIPRGATTVVTGVSGSGKSTLAFDIIFAEGQRRFMESMSSWARQYVEQLPRPDIDHLSGISPTVAIEQRVTRGTRKSTVATITEVAQYLRLLYARIGVQHSPVTGEPLVALPPDALIAHLQRAITRFPGAHRQDGILLHLMAPLVRGRKGHHEPLANWARDHQYRRLRIDGQWVNLVRFRKLDRFREHTVDLVVASITVKRGKIMAIEAPAHPQASDPGGLPVLAREALALGKGGFFIDDESQAGAVWFSTRRSDPVTGEAFPDLDPKDFSWNAPRGWCPVCRGHGHLAHWMRDDDRFERLPARFEDLSSCPECSGHRLNPVSRAVFLKTRSGGRYNLPELLSLTPAAVLDTLDNLAVDPRGQAILSEILPEIRERLHFMDEVGLHYLSLDRPTSTLSGGEAQRIRLAAQLGSNLSGALYVLDEPSIGLHEQDNDRLLDSLDALKAKGNTLLVVEHDTRTMQRADHIIDLGPGAGRNGGTLLAEGNWQSLLRHPESLTGRYLQSGIPHPLRGAWRPLPKPFNPRSPTSREHWIRLAKASLRNLKGVDLLIPKQRLVMVCGVSGAGKSTLVRDLLLPAARRSIDSKSPTLRGNPKRDGFASLGGAASFRSVIEVDQSPIGKTPRSTPATYIGAFDRIRDLFAGTPEARMHGYPRGTFSFNTSGGRCETCKGAGRVRLEMSFLPDTYVPCQACQGRRFGPELEEIRWKGASIADVLEMSFEEAATFFSFDSQLAGILNLMVETGLGYLTLGQSSPTLSGGEAQRLKLVSELAKGLPSLRERSSASVLPNLYLLEEPTIGLHLSDCERLLHLLHRLVDLGHSVIVIEHHIDLLAEADYLVEVGPGGGGDGGHLLYQGPARNLSTCPHSPTAPYIAKVLDEFT